MKNITFHSSVVIPERVQEEVGRCIIGMGVEEMNTIAEKSGITFEELRDLWVMQSTMSFWEFSYRLSEGFDGSGVVVVSYGNNILRLVRSADGWVGDDEGRLVAEIVNVSKESVTIELFAAEAREVVKHCFQGRFSLDGALALLKREKQTILDFKK